MRICCDDYRGERAVEKKTGRQGRGARARRKQEVHAAGGEGNVEALLVNYQGNHFAYVNRCPHVGLSMDWLDNQFFTVDGRYLMCANHGAVFEPPSGECVWGPCVGASLQSLALEIIDDDIFAGYPEDDAGSGF